MQPNLTPTSYLYGGPLGKARFKAEPEDFVVEENLGFEPSGDGEHCLLWVEKRDLDSNTVVTLLADALGIRRRLVSHCGLKDRHAVTRQWFSIHLPGEASPEPSSLESEGLRVLKVKRNLRKLRRGTHLGNRFRILLREVEADPVAVKERWDMIRKDGVPNLFGPQRFGHGGRNIEKALAMFRGEFETRDRLLRGLLLSSIRSHLFNEFVGERIKRGNWNTPVEGEVFGFSDNRSLILPEKCRGDEGERFHQGDLEITAPLWGTGELHSTGALAEFEAKCATLYPEMTAGLENAGLQQERRVMRVTPGKARFETLENGCLLFEFDLPKGTYATVVLSELFSLVEEPRGSGK